MTIQDLAPDLSICQEAKEKGVEIESQFFWREDELKKIPICVVSNCRKKEAEELEFKYYPAPLTDEILEKLPVNFKKEGMEYWLQIFKRKGNYLALYISTDEVIFTFEINIKLSNALLKLAIRLKEEGIIKYL